MMCIEYDPNEYDPFEPIYVWDEWYIDLEIDSEPMTDEDWEGWLSND